MKIFAQRSVIIKLDDEVEQRLIREAARIGLAPATYAALLIEKHLPAPHSSTSLAQMFKEWDTEDATDDPAEIARRNREFQELRQRINANRIESEGPDARTPF